MTENCKNCSKTVVGNFCNNCGQKSSTHRYSLKHFVEHDIIHGVWHVDKGILFTIKVLFTRPGHAVREFIHGKRANLFNFISLIILLIAVSSFLAPYTRIRLTDLLPQASRASMNSLEKFAREYPKVVLLFTIPFYSFFSYFWFRKTKLNFTEHLVLNSYKTSAELVVGLLFTILTIFYTNTGVLIFIYYFFIVILTLIYSIWFYYQFFSQFEYKKRTLLLRSVLVPLSYFLFSLIVGIVVAIIQNI